VSRADEIRAQARALSAVVRPAEDARDGREHRHGVVAPLTRPVRRSVDLTPAQHAELVDWCVETARVLGKARISGQEVFRALVARLLTDEALARKLRADLRADQ